MNLNINGHHLEITPAIKKYITDKLGRVKRHFDHVIDVSVTLSITKLEHNAEVTLRVPNKEIHVQATHTDMYAAIDSLIDKLDRQVLRHKGKLTNHSHTPIKHQVVETEVE